MLEGVFPSSSAFSSAFFWQAAGQESLPNEQANNTAGSLHSEGFTFSAALWSINITQPLISVAFGSEILFIIPASFNACKCFA